MHKFTLQVSPYFHILALFKSFSPNLQPKLIKQEFTTNSYNNSNLILPLIPTNYLHVDCYTTSSYSYPIVTTIPIDMHPAVETWYTRHIHAHDKPYMTTLHADSTELDKFIAPEKKGLPSWFTAHRLTDLRVPPSFSPIHDMKQGKVRQF
jgi:hypothetical protein